MLIINNNKNIFTKRLKVKRLEKRPYVSPPLRSECAQRYVQPTVPAREKAAKEGERHTMCATPKPSKWQEAVLANPKPLGLLGAN